MCTSTDVLSIVTKLPVSSACKFREKKSVVCNASHHNDTHLVL